MVAEVLGHRSEIAGVLLERPGMLELAKCYLSEQGVADHCELVEGDFFSPVPAGGDVYVLKSVLHDWDDDRCVAILRNCRAAMDEAARLVIAELSLPERMTASAQMLSAALLDLIMLAYGEAASAPRENSHLLRSGQPPPGQHNRADSRAAPPRSHRRVGQSGHFASAGRRDLSPLARDVV